MGNMRDSFHASEGAEEVDFNFQISTSEVLVEELLEMFNAE